ncbi:telomerase reverse transcriptase isoform X3 [Ranitomeya variabilis]|uniref:telomerase reverse transcriptase isoform X3 n=1 Tax=Ranitomeya variabilis TaxID=490064 RepID=UPI004055F13A
MAAPGPPLLQAVYGKVYTIRHYVRVLHTDSEPGVQLQQEGDTDRYKSFLSGLLVCIPPQAKRLCSPTSFVQISTQREVVARVIQRICEKNKKNVLAFGYGLVAEKSSLRVKFAPNICSYFPNPTTATISTSVLWETLLSRVGDVVMMHLLENCSVFMRVPPSCCYQMCGQPIYNLTKDEILKSPWLKQDRFIYKGNILSRYIKTCSFKSKTCSLKLSTQRKRIKSQRNAKVKASIDLVVQTGEVHSSTAPVKDDNHFVPASEHLLREKILSKFLFWLMDTYVIQLLKAFYYITETSFQKNRLFFYRKRIWGSLQEFGIRKHMRNVKLRLMSTDEIVNMQQQKNTPLISRLRFIPKINGLRPIVKLCNTLGAQPSKEIKKRKIQHFSTQVRNLFSVLNYERNKSSYMIGSSVFGLDDIYKKWRKYVLEVKESKSENEKLYFVKTDIKEAYDTIPHSKLAEVISQVINTDNEEVYCIRRYAMLWMDSQGQIRKTFKRHVSNLVDFLPNMKCFLTHFQEDNLVQNAIFVEQSLYLNENSSKLLSFLQQIIFNHILRIYDRYYMQCCGIPQGSVLSALLCSLCYGDMENKLFCGIQENSIFMRLIDDFLLVTPHLDEAKQFLRTLAAGIPEYGCSISLDKTVVNFPIDDIPECSTVEQLPARSLFRWCGLLLDTHTLEVFCDYSSFSCTSIRSSLSFCHNSNAGENLRHKLLSVLRLKCHSLFLDLQINTLQTVHINAYKILLLQAYRFHVCVRQLPFDQSIKNNPLFFLTIISDMAACFYVILKEKNKDFILGTKNASGPFPFESAQWLNCHAFLTKLSNHKSLYKTLLFPLCHCKRQLSRMLSKETVGVLKEVTDASFHKDFSTIMD